MTVLYKIFALKLGMINRNIITLKVDMCSCSLRRRCEIIRQAFIHQVLSAITELARMYVCIGKATAIHARLTHPNFQTGN